MGQADPLYALAAPPTLKPPHSISPLPQELTPGFCARQPHASLGAPEALAFGRRSYEVLRAVG